MRDVRIINRDVVYFMKTKLFWALPNYIQSVKLRKNVIFSNFALRISNLRLIGIGYN
jgi:hypothetical protein